MIRLVSVQSAEHLEDVRQLFREYEKNIGVDLCFQNFAEEVKQLPGAYSEPHGALLLAIYEDKPAACCALRPAQQVPYAHAGELKRLFVRPGFRGKGIARKLVTEVLRRATDKGYECVVLDTLQTMSEAQTLYRALGFEEIPAYYENPKAGTKYMKLDLRSAGLQQ